jgi:hypothetical protein|tara:strand:+ start:799 stop:1257 length:459 start_codon:yes stop_codon:yes gene_type:complete
MGIYMSYKGKYKIKKPEKYLGDYTKVIYRSLWERQAFKWCEANTRIKAWNSEEVVIPYKCKTDNRIHRYYIDLFIEMDDGECILVEIKPKTQTKAPKKPARKTKRYINEVTAYIKNTSKWVAANQFANHKGWKFQIWTEDTLKNLGIKLLKS